MAQFNSRGGGLSPDAAVNGTEGPDTLYGTNGADTINGNGGDDWIDAGLGSEPNQRLEADGQIMILTA